MGESTFEILCSQQYRAYMMLFYQEPDLFVDTVAIKSHDKQLAKLPV